MKKLILGLVAVSTLATPALAQPFGGHQGRGFEQTRFVQSNHRNAFQAHRSWRKGDRFDSRYVRNYREIRNPRAYRLRDAPRGYRWVQSGNDAVLIGITSGLVASIMANILR